MTERLELNPQSLSEVGEALDEAARFDLPVHITGSGLHTRNPPRIDHARLSTRGLATLRDLDRKSCVAHAEAGMTVGELESAITREGLTLAYLGPMAEDATLGGLLSRFWPMAPVISYPDVRGACIGLTALVERGHVYHYLPAPRKASGPDLRGWFMGTEGRAGIITELWLGLARRPERHLELAFDLDSPDAATADALFGLLRGGVRPWHCGLHIDADSPRARLHITLGGPTPNVDLWEQQIGALELGLSPVSVDAPDPKALRTDAFAEPGCFVAVGDNRTIAQALQWLSENSDDGNAVSISHWTPYGARLVLPDTASPPEELSKLPWSATSGISPSPLATRLSGILDADGRYLASRSTT